MRKYGRRYKTIQTYSFRCIQHSGDMGKKSNNNK